MSTPHDYAKGTLWLLREGRPLPRADRIEDRIRQMARKAGLIEFYAVARGQWAITEAGLNALAAIEKDEAE